MQSKRRRYCSNANKFQAKKASNLYHPLRRENKKRHTNTHYKNKLTETTKKGRIKISIKIGYSLDLSFSSMR